jgi:hypothetical protein
MHPIERLRYVARVEGADFGLVAMESASALAAVAASDIPALVPSCRRLVEGHVTNGPLWWLSARVLASPEPVHAAREAAAALEADPTERVLAREVPDETSVLVVGWPDIAAEALSRRGDLEVFVAESGGEGDGLVRRLSRDRHAGPSGLMAAPGSHAAASVARQAGVPVWAVAGVGRVLPEALWNALLARVDQSGLEPWDRDDELVPAELLDAVVGPEGRTEVGAGLAASTCPAVPELLRPTA